MSIYTQRVATRKQEKAFDRRDKRRRKNWWKKRRSGPVTVLAPVEVQDQYGEVFDPVEQFNERVKLL